jgi:hypothetical protein
MGPIEQIRPEIAFQLAHAQGDRGLRGVQSVGGSGKAAELDGPKECLELLEFHRLLVFQLFVWAAAFLVAQV